MSLYFPHLTRRVYEQEENALRTFNWICNLARDSHRRSPGSTITCPIPLDWGSSGLFTLAKASTSPFGRERWWIGTSTEKPNIQHLFLVEAVEQERRLYIANAIETNPQWNFNSQLAHREFAAKSFLNWASTLPS